MVRSLAAVLLSVIAAPLAAQLAPSARLDAGAVRIGAAAANLPPAGADAWGGFSALTNAANGSAHLAVQQTCSATAVDVQWQFGCQAFAQTNGTAGASVRYEFASPVAVHGLLSITWLVQASGTGAAQLAIDVGDDGIVDATDSGVLPVVFGPGALVVRVTASANATAGSFHAGWSTWHYSGAVQGALVLGLAPDAPAVQMTSAACGALSPGLAVLPTFAGGVQFRGACAPPDDIAVLVLGMVGAALPLGLPPGCALAVRPDVTAWQLPDAQRGVAWELAVPPAVRPLALHAQLLGLHVVPMSIATSSALRVVL